MPACHFRSPADVPQWSSRPSPQALVCPRGPEEAARLRASCQRPQRELLRVLHLRSALWPGLPLAVFTLQQLPRPPAPAVSRRLSCPGFAVELTWCFGVCCLPWLSFLSRFAGINLRDPSMCKRRTTRLSGPSQACPVMRWAGKRCLCLCARLLP